MQLKFKSIEKKLHYFFTTFTLLAFCCMAAAQAKFSTVVRQKSLAVDEYVQVEYTIENAKSVEKIDQPSFKNFRVIQGPIQSNGMSIMNGVLSQYKSLTYVLQPTITGRLTIPGTAAVADGKAVRSEPVMIEVSKKGGRGNNNNLMPAMPLFPDEEPEVEEEYLLKQGESMADKIKNNLFIKADVNKTTCFEGEPIVATFKLCSRLRSESKVLKRPSLNGFSVLDMVDPDDNRPTIETINGKRFNVHIIRKTQLFPLQAGAFEIDPVELDNTVRFIKPYTDNGNGSGSPMQRFMDEFRPRGEVVEQSFTLGSKPIAITVKPLPAANKPVGFNGAIGKFTLHVDGKKKTIRAGEELSLKVEIKGQGNFTMINPLPLELPDGMEGYDPVIKENVDKTVYPLSGSKTFLYTFIPKDTGNYLIPAISFSYFDPGDARYKTENTDSFYLHVTKSSKRKNAIMKILRPAESILPVRWMDSLSVNTLALMLAVFFAAGLGIYQWRKHPRDEKSSAQVQPAPRQDKEKAPFDIDALEHAKQAMQEGKSQQFYSALNQAVWKALLEKVSVPSSELNKFNAVAQLRQKGASELLIGQLQSVLHDCEIALYTPVHTPSDMQHTLTKAEALIGELKKPVV